MPPQLVSFGHQDHYGLTFKKTADPGECLKMPFQELNLHLLGKSPPVRLSPPVYQKSKDNEVLREASPWRWTGCKSAYYPDPCLLCFASKPPKSFHCAPPTPISFFSSQLKIAHKSQAWAISGFPRYLTSIQRVCMVISFCFPPVHLPFIAGESLNEEKRNIKRTLFFFQHTCNGIVFGNIME